MSVGHVSGSFHRGVRSFLAAGFIVSALTSIVTSASMRDQIEADWRKQDEHRLLQIRQPGQVWFVETKIHWPGVGRDDRIRVPKGPTPKLDAVPDEGCWSNAFDLAPKQAGLPETKLMHDGRSLFVGLSLPTRTESRFRGDPTALDAGGAVDGVKNGRYAFHTNHEPNPWWQADLGKPRAIGKIVVYNRLDYAPGLHNADNLRILTSDDGEQWTLRHDNKGTFFGGVGKGGPLVVEFAPTAEKPNRKPIRARYVRLQIPSPKPIFLHLDEVEIYAADDPTKNIALNRPARQSSLSIWSRGYQKNGAMLTVGPMRIGFATEAPHAITLNGTPAPPSRAQIRRAHGTTTMELALPLQEFPNGFPDSVAGIEGPPVRLAAGGTWRLKLPPAEQHVLGFGRNRLSFRIESHGAVDPPVDVQVESVVFTPQRPERAVVFHKKVREPGTIEIPFQVTHEGPAAVLITARQEGVQYHEGLTYFIAPAARTINRARELLADYRRPEDDALRTLAQRIATLAQAEAANGPDPTHRADLYRQARWLARDIAFRHPNLQFKGLLFVKRFTQETYPDVCLNHMPWVSRPGGDICILPMHPHDQDRPLRTLINGRLGPGHVHGMDLWWNADRVVFGYAQAKSDQPPDGWLDRRTNFHLRRTEEPTHIFEMNTDGSNLRQLTDGEWSDLDPTYCANGDIVFVSERCRCSLQCNEYDKDETSCNLYVMRPDGSNIRRMSVTKDGDYLPHSLDDGMIAYTRWEYQERSFAHIQSIWVIRPDGTGADALFKQHMNNPWALEDTRSIPGCRELISIAAGHHTLATGPVVIVDPDVGLNNEHGIGVVTPGIWPPEGGMSGSPVTEGGVTGAGGFYMTPWAISDKTFLVSATYGPERDAKGYALYLIDVYGTKELIYRDPEISCSIPIPLRPRPKPPVLARVADPNADHAVCAVADVGYRVDGIEPERIRYLRISKRDQWPYCNTYGGQRYEKDVKGVFINWTPARVIGTVPVEADGSAHFRVPADTPVFFQLLDENHQELRRMRSFISFQPGEQRSCLGCHETRAEAPPSTTVPLALRRGPRIPIPPPWGRRAVSFLRDIQPVFDRHCVRCHGGLEPAGGLDFSGGLTARYNRAYETINKHRLVARSNIMDDAKVTPPLAFGSHKSKLIHVIQGERHRKTVDLSRDDWLRLVTWIDLNAPYHDDFINKRREPMPYDLASDGPLREQIAAVHEKRCASCHKPADVTRLDWIDLHEPRESLFLRAPLDAGAGGTARCKRVVYANQTDPDYQRVLKLIESASRKAWDRPRRDLRALARK